MKMPNTPFATRLSGSAKETELRLRSIFQWKRKRPPMVLFVLTAALVLLCCGLVSCENQAEGELPEVGVVQDSPDESQVAELFESYVSEFTYYTYTGWKTSEHDGRIFTMEDTPKNLAEAAVIECYRLNWMGETSKTGLCCGNETLAFEPASHYKTYTIHELSTLVPEDFTVEAMPFLDSFLRELTEDIQTFGLVEYTVVYADLSWEWTDEALKLGPQLGNGRYERLYLMGKTAPDGGWKLYNVYWGEYIYDRILADSDPALWNGTPISFHDGVLTVHLPESWAGKVRLETDEHSISVYHQATCDLMEAEQVGHMYTVTFLPGEFYSLNYTFPWPSGVIAVTDEGTYAYYLPSDVQFLPQSEQEYTELFNRADEVQFILSDELVETSLNEQNPDHPDFVTRSVVGRTAVLIDDTTLQNCYSCVYWDPADLTTYGWFASGVEPTLKKGDILLVLEEVDGLSRVVIPYGDVPWLYGFVDSSSLSADKALIEQGNQAIIADETSAYDEPGGTETVIYGSRVLILEEQDGWTKVQSYGTGDNPWWVDSDDLTYNFDFASVVDAPSKFLA